VANSRRYGKPIVLLAAAALLLVTSCETRSPLRIRPGPVITAHRFSLTKATLAKIAVIPFYPVGQPTNAASAGTSSLRRAVSADTAVLIGSYFSEAMTAQGFVVIPPSDVETAFLAAGHPVPRLDARASAELAASVFGATSVALGKVTRFREREGGAAGAARPASVAFEISLHDVPTARRLWTGRFDETQLSITEGIFRARQYPGGGTRWLTASEFARWGANETAKSIAGGP
jgi:hypothetical protein